MEGFFKKGLFFKRSGSKAARDGQNPAKRPFSKTFDIFQKTLSLNNQALEAIAMLGDVLSGDYIFDQHFIEVKSRELAETVYQLIGSLNTLSPKFQGLYEVFQRINDEIEQELSGRLVIPKSDYVMPYSAASRDFQDVVGAKNANLAEVANALGFKTPPGFVATTRAFGAFMDHNDLWEKTESLTKAWKTGEISLEDASEKIQSMILDAKVPKEVRKEIQQAVGKLEREQGYKNLYFAVRSSAGGEDGEHSFAGLHLSVLNTPPEELLDAYKRVIASLYSGAVMEYRKDKGFLESEAVMAVGCLVMVDAQASGVVYTMDPMNPDSGKMVISSARGLGASVVSGDVSGDRHLVSRTAPFAIEKVQTEPQEKLLSPKPNGGVDFTPVEENLLGKQALSREQLQTLAEAALQIERHFKRPLDIEYAFDKEGEMYILQARPLKLQTECILLARDLPALLSDYKIIFKDQGTVAQRGVGAGRVFLATQRDEDLDDFPSGAILVARHTSPRFAKIIRKAGAILTDVGSPTGHLATIAREFRVPAIVGSQVATSLLKQGQEITVDAEANIIYDGIVKELETYNLCEEHIEESHEYRLLRRILKKVAPLNLVDPHSRSFSPQGARTFHDITRFVHEKAVEELINLQNVHRHDPDTVSGKLKIPVPLDLVLIDIGHGLAPRENKRVITMDDIQSLPMKSFINGLTKPGAWSTAPANVDFSSFMSSLTRTFASGLSSPDMVGQNLAVISDNYANISLRLGYHFNMIDSYIGDNQNSNYAYFRFMGGVTDATRRSRRARFLAELLSIGDFRVEIRGDLVVARLKKLPSAVMQGKLYFLGVLVAYARQLDVQMTSDSHVSMYVDMFRNLMQSNAA
ncbi:pyruvate, water dikinase [Desulfatibacillum alkenivorans DSM 16219]|jgi:pyruvate,water dikinase|uniref:Phosphoenolpyruvate synthase n=1 Tax=Desulfatibacillum alkenivorans DSM 16219 TaxID=1121393 RepID=A0A1M6XLH9_9BACT|nr:PEP/pyruvate-binding domain-containing protein [Desulfatibacillum alkenivorans]SHL06768.1 pyruvate, water dikinase [Desulfatibacillum alkenivorans DSM 16219]